MDQPTEQPRGPYAGHEPITGDDVARVDAALEKCKGNQAHAAVVAGVTPKRLANVIAKDATLRVKWGKHDKRDMPESDSLERSDPVGPFSPSEVKAARAVERQDLLIKNWEKRFKPDQIEFLRDLQNSYAVNLKGTMDLVYGGAAHTATRLLMVFEDLVKRIEDVDTHPEKYERIHQMQFGQNVVKDAHDYRIELYDRLISISGELRKVNTDLTKANWVRAQLAKLASGEGDQMKRKKQGWSSTPVSVHAAPGSNVTIVENAAPDVEDVS